jgi:hypothetical protein
VLALEGSLSVVLSTVMGNRCRSLFQRVRSCLVAWGNDKCSVCPYRQQVSLLTRRSDGALSFGFLSGPKIHCYSSRGLQESESGRLNGFAEKSSIVQFGIFSFTVGLRCV